MPLDAILLLALLAAALTSLFFELLPVDVTGLCLLLALILGGLVPQEEALAGFSNKGVLTIGALFILSHALQRTGLLEIVGERLSRRFGKRRWVGIGVLLVLVALMSGLLNNTAVVAMTIPLAMQLCRRFQISPSQVLIPLSFASIFGGTLTLIGTSTNLLVSAMVEEAGGKPLGMFELTPLGLVFLGVGLGYVLLLAPRALPSSAKIESLTDDFQMGGYLTELRVVETSSLVGKTVSDLRMSERYDVTLLTVIRGSERIVEKLRTLRFLAGDILLVRGATPGLWRLRKETAVELLSDVTLTDKELANGRQVVVEALVTANSSLIGQTLHDIDFRRRYGAFVLAIRRQQSTLRERLTQTRLRFADTLLIVAFRDRLSELKRNGDLLVASELDLQLHRGRFWWLPMILIPTIMLLAALGVLDLLVGVLGAVAILLVLGVIRTPDSYRAIDWRVIFFIAAFIPVGDAMLRTGLAEKVASAVLIPTTLAPERFVPWVAVAVLYLVTSVATETLTNSAAAIVLTPVALRMATDLDADPRGLILTVCFAASASFMTPTGYQTNMMVYGPGNYRFTDFTRFGAPLKLIFWILATLLIPWLYPPD
jgi:di/tricarboxylate transporter